MFCAVPALCVGSFLYHLLLLCYLRSACGQIVNTYQEIQGFPSNTQGFKWVSANTYPMLALGNHFIIFWEDYILVIKNNTSFCRTFFEETLKEHSRKTPGNCKFLKLSIGKKVPCQLWYNHMRKVCFKVSRMFLDFVKWNWMFPEHCSPTHNQK